MTSIGFRVKTAIERPAPGLIEKIKGFPTCTLADAMGRFHALHPAIKALHAPGLLMAGTAITVRVSPADNLMIHKAIDLAQPGDVIVIDAGGDVSHAVLGGVLVRIAKRNGVAGFVVDGAVRDVTEIRAEGIPVYARGTTPAGPYKDGPGEVNFPVACGGVPVRPGDIIIGDDDGVVVIPPEAAEEVIRKAEAIEAAEARTLQQLEEGTLDRAWVDETLSAKGCQFI